MVGDWKGGARGGDWRAGKDRGRIVFVKNPNGAIARNPDDMVCGSPETVTRAMRAFADSGIGVMICGLLIDADDPSCLHRSVSLFEQEVIPRVAADRLARGA